MSANWAAWAVIVVLAAALAGSIAMARARRSRADRGWHDALGRAGLGPDRRRRSP